MNTCKHPQLIAGLIESLCHSIFPFQRILPSFQHVISNSLHALAHQSAATARVRLIKESQNTFINLFLRKCSHPTCICYRRQHSSTMTSGHVVWFLRLSFLLLCNHCWFRNCWSFLRSVIPDNMPGGHVVWYHGPKERPADV